VVPNGPAWLDGKLKTGKAAVSAFLPPLRTYLASVLDINPEAVELAPSYVERFFRVRFFFHALAYTSLKFILKHI
jgi:hypothetical protein